MKNLVVSFAVLAFGGVCAAPPDLELRTWRVTTENCTFSAESEFADRSPVYRLAWPADKPGEKGKVEFSNFETGLLRRMLDSWMPPYVGAHAKQIAFSVYHIAGGGKLLLEFDVSGKHVFRHFESCQFVRGTWKDYAFDVNLKPGEALGGVRIRFNGGGTHLRFLLADLRVVLDDGRTYEILNPDPPCYTAMMKEPARTKAAKCEPTRPVLKFGASTAFVTASRDKLAEYGAYMKRYLPEYDIMLQLAWQSGVSFADCLEALPENVFAQFAFGQHDLRYAKLMDALVKDESGRPQHRTFNSTVATHPLLRDTYRDLVQYCGTLGYNCVQQYDYVWMYPDGHWGFDAATVAAFREDLLGKDERLVIGAREGEPEHSIGFWDYYHDHFGPETPQPADFGFASWAEFRPSLATDAATRLYRTLITYEWLRQAQRFGQWTKEFCYGGSFDFLLNGEAPYNGNDHLYLPRLKYVGRVHPEYFDRTPRVIEMTYRSAGLGIRNARRYGKSWGITVETSQGAGGSQPYWSEKTGYVMCYVLSALGYDTFEYDCAPVTKYWPDNIDRSNGAWHSLSLGMADARGFRQAKKDGAAKEASSVYLLTEHIMAGRRPNLFDPFAPDFAEDDFRGVLRSEQVDWETTVPQELKDILPSAKVIFLSPWVTRKDVREQLMRWASEAPGRTLVTEKAQIAETVARLGLRRTQRATADRTAYVMPFAAKEGRVAALVNRQAAKDGYADWNRWRKEVWSKTAWCQKYRYEDLMYKDVVVGADVHAEVFVAKDGMYRVYRPMADREELVEAKNGRLTLTLGDTFCDLFYYGEDTEEYRAFLETVKADRAITADFFVPSR